MKFSVIVPTYMEEDVLEECLKKINAQDFERNLYEIIVSDSNSSDRTVDIANKYADKVVITPKRGISIGRNEGAKKALGEILLFVDSDVKLDKTFLKKLKEDFDRPNIVAVTGRAVPDDGGIFAKFVYNGTFTLMRIFNKINKPLYPGMCVAYRKDIFFKVNGFREDYGIVEDLDLSNRVSAYGECIVNTQAKSRVSTRRLDENGLSTVFFHIYNDIKYLLGGKPARYYPKKEEIKSWKDLWKINSKK